MKKNFSSLAVVILLHLLFLRSKSQPPMTEKNPKREKKIQITLKTHQRKPNKPKVSPQMSPSNGSKTKHPKQSHHGDKKISFKKIGQKLQAVFKNAPSTSEGYGEKLSLSGSSKGMYFIESIRMKMDYDARLFRCGLSGRVIANIVFNQRGKLDEKRSRIQTHHPYLRIHTLKQLRQLSLPPTIKGPFQVKIIFHFVRNKTATHANSFITGSTLFQEVLAMDRDKGDFGPPQNCFDAPISGGCRESDHHYYRQDPAW